MAQGLNRVQIIGFLGKDPEIRLLGDGASVANFTVAVSESWKDKHTGEKKEKTEWIKCVAFGPLAKIVEQYTKKGAQVFVEGKFCTRKWQNKDGADQWTTEVQLSGFDGKFQMLDRAGGGQQSKPASAKQQDMDDDIPWD